MKYLLFLLIASTASAQSLSPRITNLEAVYSLKYHPAEATVGSVGSVGQIKAGHILTAKSFPAASLGVDKVAWWNLASASDNSAQTSCSSGAAACDFTPSGAGSGSIGFTGTDLFGTARVVSFNGTNQYFVNTNSFVSPTASQSFAVGGWVKATDWTPTNSASLFSNQIVGDYSFQIILAGTGSGSRISFRTASSSASAYDFVATGGAPGWTDGTWHHIAGVFSYTMQTLSLYWDGQLAAQVPATNIRPCGSSAFAIGADASAGGVDYFAGSYQDVFFLKNYDMTAQDIRRLYSTRIDHNQNIPAYRQDLRVAHNHLGAGTSYAKLPFLWSDLSDANSAFVDFSDLDATDKLDIRLYSLQN